MIVLDLTLPDTDGWEICRRLKTDGRTKIIAIVILTARDEPKRPPARHSGWVRGICEKALPPVDLIAVITRVLREHESV